MVVRRRLDLSGQALVFVTTTVTDWLPVLDEEVFARAVLIQLRDALNHYHVSLVGYVLMPSHLHALLGFPQIKQLSKFMQSFKILSSKRIKELILGGGGADKDSPPASRPQFRDQLFTKGKFRLWKPRFDDVLITSQEQFKVKLDYIHNNPVKAGLIDRAEDWKYSSAGDWLSNRAGVITIDKEFEWIM